MTRLQPRLALALLVMFASATAALGSASRLAAQAAPPAPPVRPAPPPPLQDSALALKRPPTSPPPSTVAPSGRALLRPTGPAALPPVEPVARVSAPADSVRPAAASAPPVTPLAPAPPPPRPAARTAGGEAARAVSPATAPPLGATMLCKDGTYLTGAPSAERCADHGGLATIFPAQPTAPPPPRRP